MSKTSTAVKNRWNAKAYDAINLRIPKGRKAAFEAFAREQGESVNGLINRLMRQAMGLTDGEWKRAEGDGLPFETLPDGPEGA